ncbi:MAG TPA: hypothetical protein VK541_17455 [Pedobacter sp.]|uniref:hypothetical protein n=1 Tax=Pedobacter sp. TaxID=1411316 RepID=UPI002D10241E|nr:hypothetical protein [Pedobacter sp.]HMI04279.1 hypothetical protein [Pedobacter sp.]
MARARRDGKAYDSADAQIVIKGELYDEITEITYGNDQEHQLNHSLGVNATSWSKGKITPKCSMTMYMTDSVRLERQGGGSVLNLKPFDIQVSFVNDDNEIINDTIVAKFQNEGREVTG